MDVKLEHPEISEEESEPTISEKDLDFLLSSAGSREIPFGNPVGGGAVTLAAFDTYRQAAASMLGCAFMKFSGDQIQEFAISGTYNGMWRDVIIYGFLCAHDKRVALKAASNPAYYSELAIKWADDNGVELMGQKSETLANLLGAEIIRIWSSQSEVDPVGSKSGGESLGES